MKSTIILLTIFCFISCKNEVREAEQETIRDFPDNLENEAGTAHNSRNSLDWAGDYEGFLPCEDCDEIKVNLQLAENLDYVLSRHYLGRAEGKENSIQETGKFTWDNEGNSISLGEHQKLYFKVGENYLLQVFKDESKLMGGSAKGYRLNKTTKL